MLSLIYPITSSAVQVERASIIMFHC